MTAVVQLILQLRLRLLNDIVFKFVVFLLKLKHFSPLLHVLSPHYYILNWFFKAFRKNRDVVVGESVLGFDAAHSLVEEVVLKKLIELKSEQEQIILRLIEIDEKFYSSCSLHLSQNAPGGVSNFDWISGDQFFADSLASTLK